MVRIAKRAVTEARHVAANARRTLRRLGDAASGKLCAIAGDLELTADGVAQIAEQTEKRLHGEVRDGATRLVSLHDSDARLIRKGRLGKPVEFGYKAQVVDNEDGVVIDHNVEIGNPPDAPMLVPAIERVTRWATRVPKAVTADRGYGETAVGEQLSALGVRTVVLPTKANRVRHDASSRAERSSSAWWSGEREARDGSAASNGTSDGTGHKWAGSKESAPGVVTGSSTTTW